VRNEIRRIVRGVGMQVGLQHNTLGIVSSNFQAV
jgi:hypothetical protein